MSEMQTFEERFAARLRIYAAPAARPPTTEAVARAVEAARGRRDGPAGRLSWPVTRRGPRFWVLAGALLVLGLLGGALAGSLQPKPDDSPSVRVLLPTNGSDGPFPLAPGRWTTAQHMPVQVSFDIPTAADDSADFVQWGTTFGTDRDGNPNSMALRGFVERETTRGSRLLRPLVVLHIHVLETLREDPCTGGDEFTAGTLEEFESWLSAHPNVRLPLPPADVSVAGHPAREFTSLKVECPAQTEPGWLWSPARDGRIEFADVEALAVVDVEGALVAVGNRAWDYPYAPTPLQQADVDAVLDSLRLAPPGDPTSGGAEEPGR